MNFCCFLQKISGSAIFFIGPDNAVDKYAVAVMNEDRVAEHFMKREREKLAKIVLFFLRADVSNMIAVKINGKAVNKGKKGNGSSLYNYNDWE